MYEQYLYKQELLNTFGKDNELVDAVQLQLRQKIIHKLKSKQASQPPNIEQSLLKKICNSLLVQYLENMNYFHSLAVFSPEANYTKHHFSNEQMQSMLRLNNQEGESLLEGLVKSAMPKGRMIEKRLESATQTDDQQTIQSLQNKLSAVDFSYKQKMVEGLKTVQDSQLRLVKYKNQLNKRYKTQLQAEINRIRSFQIANIRMEEQQKHKLKLKELEEELQTNYRLKMEKLREREAEIIQRVTTKMKEIETYNYQARQRILRDMENVRAREEELDKMKEQLQVKELQLASSK